jgi:hypothetical protein
VAIAVVLALVGGVEMLMFQGVGGRIPPAPEGVPFTTPFHEPWQAIVWPLWRGEPVPPWKEGIRFDRTIVSEAWPRAVAGLPVGWRWLSFVPLLAGQIVAISLLFWVVGESGSQRRERLE